jgi:hypothetical protein
MGRRARPEYAVHRSKRPNGGMYWYIIGRPDGKRVRAWFTSKEKAQAEATERNTKLRKLGSEAVTVDNALIVQTALESDNSPEIIKADYLDVGVTREDADAFWKIFPEHETKRPPPQ